MLIAIHSDGIFTYVNPYTASLLAGGDQKEIIGKPLSHVVHPDFHDMVELNLHKRRQSRDTIEYAKQKIVTHDGQTLFIRWYSTPIVYEGRPCILAIGENITETNTLTNALQESEEKFRLLVENARDAIYKCTYRGDFIYMNPSGLAMLGYDPETLYHLNYTDIIPPEAKTQEYNFYMSQFKKYELETYHELPILKRDGNVIWVGQYVILAHEKETPCFYGIARDITELRTMRISLEKSEQKYRDMLENMNEGYFETDLKGNFTYSNNAGLRLAGIQRDEIERGISYTHLMTPETAQRVYEAFHRIYLTGKEEKINYDIINSDGQVRHLQASAQVRRNDNNEIVGFSGILLDLTEQTQTERSLKASEQTYRLLAENSTDIIWVLDAQTLKFTYLSPAITRLRGFTPEEGLKESLQEVFPPVHLERVLAIFAAELEKEKTGLYDPNRSVTFEAEQYTKDGSTIWVEISTRFLRNEEGALIGAQGSTRDITDRKRAENERDNYAEHLEDLVAEKTMELSLRIEKNQQEMEAAQKVQQEILPQQPPQSDLVTVAFRYAPVDELGGDFISFTNFKENQSLGVMIGDVSGHGIEAALYTMMIKAISDRLLRKYGLNPMEFLDYLNLELCKSMQSHFLTSVYGIIDSARDAAATFTFATAGHPLPILYNSEKDTVSYITAHGIALGAFKNITHPTAAVHLHRGDRLFLYTDGFIEAAKQNKILGFDAFLSLIFRAHRTRVSIEDTLDYILDEMGSFRDGSPQEDDMLIIAIEAK